MSSIGRADYLDAAQLPHAAWSDRPPPGRSAANANSTALAVAGLRRAGLNPEDGRFRFGCRGAVRAFSRSRSRAAPSGICNAAGQARKCA